MAGVAVIGGGASGLSAALRCRALGLQVTLFEASDRVGGVIQSVARDGWLAERGATSLAEPAPAVKELLTSAGVDGFVVRADPGKRQRYLLHRGRPVPIPSRVADLVASPLLSLTGRLRLLKEPFVEQVIGDDEESVDSFVRRRLGDEVADNIIDPYLAGSSGGEPSQLLARFVLPKLVEYERAGGSILKGALRSRRQARRRGATGGAWSCRHGLQEMLDAFVRTLGPGLRLREPVTGIEKVESGFEIAVAGRSREEFTGVVLAVTPPALKNIQAKFAAEQFEVISGLPCASIVSVSLGFSNDSIGQPVDGSGIMVGSKEGRQILDLVFASSIFPERAPAGTTLITAHLGGGRRPGMVSRTDAELETLVLSELSDILQLKGPVLFRDITRWHDAMPQTVAGHAARLDAATAIENAASRLVLCGGWRDGISIGETMTGGVNAADRLAAML